MGVRTELPSDVPNTEYGITEQQPSLAFAYNFLGLMPYFLS